MGFYLGQVNPLWLFYKRKRISRRALPEKVRVILQQLGPTFIKLGQFLSTRADIFPPDLIKELSKLQDSIPPLPYHQIEGVIQEELGAPVSKLFKEFDKRPSAAASLAQVHPATLRRGEEVIVKVQYPEARRIVETDIDILKSLASLIDRNIPDAKYYRFPQIVEEFAKMIRKELDFYHEAENAERFRRNFRAYSYVYIPRIYWEYTTDKVLVQERIRGIKITDIEGLVRSGCDPKIIAQRGASLTLKQILVDGFFHADPHPGNIFVLPGNVIAPVDFGMAQRLDKRTKDYVKRIFKAILSENPDRLLEVFSDMGMISDGELSGELEEDVFDLLQKYNRRSLQKISAREFFNEMNRLIRKYRIDIPTGFLYLGKAISTIESIGFTLDPDFKTIPFARRFMRRFLREDGKFSIIEWIGEWRDLLYRFPRDMSRALERMSEGKIRLEGERSKKPKRNRNLVGIFILGMGTLVLLYFSPKIAIGMLGGLLIWVAIELFGR